MRQLVGLISVILLWSLLFGVMTTSHAQGPDDALTATPSPPSTDDPATAIPTATPTPANQESLTVSFSELGYNNITIFTPFASAYYEFSVPSDWRLGGSTFLNLNLTGNMIGVPQSEHAGNYTFSGILVITFNDTDLKPIPVNLSGPTEVQIEIPAEALITNRSDDRHSILLFMDTNFECDSLHQGALLIDDNSSLSFSYQLSTPSIDLRDLPRPIYQRSFDLDQALLIVPEDPSQGELRAAMNVAAGFGKNTDGNLELTLVPHHQLTPEMRANHHLIYVGTFNGLPVLNDLDLPVKPGVQPAGIEHDVDDGILQMIVSPWNPRKVILTVTGENDVAVVKAAQVVTSNQIRTSGQENLAIIARVSVENTNVINPVQINQTFAQSGYENRLLNRFGKQQISYRFEIGGDQDLNADARLRLRFSHSTLIDYGRSGLTIEVNGEPVGSVRLSDETTSNGLAIIDIPRTALRTGLNELTIISELFPLDICLDPQAGSLWVKVEASSSLEISTTADAGPVPQVNDLSNFPNIFVSDPTLATTTIIVPVKETEIWDIAAQLAFYLGDQVDSTLLDLRAAYPDNISPELVQESNLIFVGRPSSIPYIAQLGDAWPAPFELGSDFANEEAFQVNYRLPDSQELGYLEIIPAPENRDNVFLGILGTSVQGVQWAFNALTTPRLNRFIRGIFQTVEDEQIITYIMSQLEVSSELEAQATPTNPPLPNANVPNDLLQATNDDAQPEWVLQLMIILSAIMLGIIMFVASVAAVRRLS